MVYTCSISTIVYQTLLTRLSSSPVDACIFALTALDECVAEEELSACEQPAGSLQNGSVCRAYFRRTRELCGGASWERGKGPSALMQRLCREARGGAGIRPFSAPLQALTAPSLCMRRHYPNTEKD